MPTILFVYGTLKRGCRNHSVLAGARFLGAAWTRALYGLVNCGQYPGLLLSDPGERVSGELWEVDAPLLARLDEFEDVPREYVRGAVELESGTAAEAYFYNLDPEGLAGCGQEWREE
jgi:gamma-glutamylaminecyclotransferase